MLTIKFPACAAAVACKCAVQHLHTLCKLTAAPNSKRHWGVRCCWLAWVLPANYSSRYALLLKPPPNQLPQQAYHSHAKVVHTTCLLVAIQLISPTTQSHCYRLTAGLLFVATFALFRGEAPTPPSHSGVDRGEVAEKGGLGETGTKEASRRRANHIFLEVILVLCTPVLTALPKYTTPDSP